MKHDIRLRGSSRKGGSFFRMLLLVIGVAIVLTGLVAGYFLFEFEKPSLILDREIRFLGGKVELPLRVSDRKSGIRSLTISLRQGEKEAKLLEKTFPRQAWFKAAGPESLTEKVVIDAQKAGIKEGSAELSILVRDFSLNGLFQGNRTEQRLAVTMDTKPPIVAVKQAQRSIQPGGSGVAVYTVSETPGRHGVMLDQTFYPGYPTGKANTYIAYFALPWDAKQLQSSKVVAYDEAGNEGVFPFPCAFKRVPEKKDSINISEVFLQQKMPEFAQHYPEMTGSLVEKYIYVNNQIRVQNAQTIAQVCASTDSTQLWSDRFLRMPGAGRAGYADQRSYLYGGQVIDNQTHLGIDIASTEKAEVRAANRGKVVFADYLGIYGNMVVIDHGQGIASLYSHLSSMNTIVGAMVEKDQPIAHTGATGMAGGDHLHFSMLVHGIFVTPTEWWDQHWINVNIKNALNEK